MATHHRIIAYFDVDCFYAQDEILRRPYLQDRPVGVTQDLWLIRLSRVCMHPGLFLRIVFWAFNQKFLVVTCNYVARNLGVPKMASIQQAKQFCPDLVLINGEDLTPYRASSKKIMAVLGRFGILERRGLDEAALDITSEVLKRAVSRPGLSGFVGHVIDGKDELDGGRSVSELQSSDLDGSDNLLLIGSHVVAEIRLAVETETGFKCSSGIATNKMLAKLASSVNKPNKQTCILGSAVSAFLEPQSVRKIPGIGHQTEVLLKEMGIVTVADLKKWRLEELSCRFGDRLGTLLYGYCRGIDDSPVQDKGAPKSLSVEDSFQPCTSYKSAEEIIRRLAPVLIARLDEDRKEYCRWPKVFSIKWRYRGSWGFKSSSTAMPAEVLSSNMLQERRSETIVDISIRLLMHFFGRQPFAIAVINIGATNFTASSCQNTAPSHDIRSFLHGHEQQSSKYTKSALGKRKERKLREGELLACQRICSLDEHHGSQSILSLNSGNVASSILQDKLQTYLDFDDGSPQDECFWASLSSDLNKIDGAFSQSVRDQSNCLISKDVRTRECLKESKNDVMSKPVIDGPSGHLGSGHKSHHTSGGEHLQDDAYSRAYSRGIDCPEVLSSLDAELGHAICGRCGQEVDGDAQSRQEHDDYHLALELSSYEHSLTGMHDFGSLPQVSRDRRKASRLSPCDQNKKARRKNGTLDYFLVRPYRSE